MKKAIQFSALILSLYLPLSCKKVDNNPSVLTDKDGNVYNTVTIGTQTWLVENLKTTKYSDGTEISNVTDSSAWKALKTGAYCDYDNIPGNSTTYGRLYNWYAVNTGKLCPSGWHVPSDEEWKNLTTYLGGESVAGGKLKETGTDHWATPNTGATNESGFTALPGGFSYGSSYFIRSSGNWWSSTEYLTINAINRSIYYNLSNIYRGNVNKTVGKSVRCLKD